MQPLIAIKLCFAGVLAVGLCSLIIGRHTSWEAERMASSNAPITPGEGRIP